MNWMEGIYVWEEIYFWIFRFLVFGWEMVLFYLGKWFGVMLGIFNWKYLWSIQMEKFISQLKIYGII